MRLNIANPMTGAQKKLEIEDENRLQLFMDRRMAEVVKGDSLGDEFKGYEFKIMGGNDNDGFPMRQGVLVNKRVRLLLRRGMPCYKAKRKGDRKRKSVRGCIVGPDIAALSLIIVKRGEIDLPGLTDTEIPRRLGPKRVDKIRKMFNLDRDDDPRDYVVRRKVTTSSGKKIIKKPKIQRLITPSVLRRRKFLKAKFRKRKHAAYEKRKAYFAGLSKQSKVVQKKKQAVQRAVEKNSKSNQQKKKKNKNKQQQQQSQKQTKGGGGKSKQQQSKGNKGKKGGNKGKKGGKR